MIQQEVRPYAREAIENKEKWAIESYQFRWWGWLHKYKEDPFNALQHAPCCDMFSTEWFIYSMHPTETHQDDDFNYFEPFFTDMLNIPVPPFDQFCNGFRR